MQLILEKPFGIVYDEMERLSIFIREVYNTYA